MSFKLVCLAVDPASRRLGGLAPLAIPFSPGIESKTMRVSPRRLCAFVVLWTTPMLPAAEPLHVRIDALIAAATPDYAKIAAPIASDAEFLRRVQLDLVGVIPTAADARTFLNDPRPDKREKLIDALLNKPEHARHLQHEFDNLLMDRRGDAKVPRAAWEEFLRASFAANKPYDQFVREMLSNDGSDAKTRPAAKFLLDRNLDPTQVTRDISRIFLGRNIQCAQCHDHPKVDDYKQEDFFGLQAFFNRAYLYPKPDAPTAVIAEKAEGEVQFISVFDPKKTAKSSPPRMLGRKPVADPKLEKGKEYKVAPAKDVRPVPAYSRFLQLGAELATAENASFVRTAVNRFWAQMMGRGLVHPLDYDHSDNPPSHPQLLDLLTAEFAAHQFDVRWLLREIALSKTYQRSSEVRDGAKEEALFSARLKPLTPDQLAFSALQASGHTETVRATLKDAAEPALYAKLVPVAAPIRNTFAAPAGEVQEFSASLDQTLFVKHGGAMRNLLNPQPGNLVDRCVKLKDDRAAAEELFLSVLTRLPTSDEMKLVAESLRAAKDRNAALSNTAWALLSSAEFRFNH